MAIIKLGVTVAGIRGTIGGITFSANKSGAHAKILSMPSRPQTILQLQQRGYLASMGTLWRSLSTAEQGDWDAFAASPPETDYNSLGEVYLLSGYGWFTRICIRRRRTAQAEDLLAPTSTPVAAPLTFDLELHPATGSPDEAICTYTVDDFLDHYVIMEMSQAPGQGSNVQTNRFLMMIERTPGTSTQTKFTSIYFARFGSTQTNQRFFARLYKQSVDAIRSTPIALFTDVTAMP